MTDTEKNNRYHEMITEKEIAEISYVVEPQEILLDLKFLMKDFYAATFTVDGEALKLTFSNGQTFMLKAEEVKVA